MVRFASRHCRLTISPARTDVASLTRDAVRLAAAAPGKGTSWRAGAWAGENSAFFEHPAAYSVSSDFDLFRVFTGVERFFNSLGMMRIAGTVRRISDLCVV
jgi:hypothetical protein